MKTAPGAPRRPRSRRARRAALLVVVGVLAFAAAACEADGDWAPTAPVVVGELSMSPQLNKVSCGTPTSCVGVGYNHAARWDGTSWADASVPGMNGFEQVGCGATFCLTNGTLDGSTTPAMWNGTTWAPSPDPTGFFDVYGGWQRWVGTMSCAGANFCVVEFADHELRKWAVFDGDSWAWMNDEAYSPDSFSQLSCASPTACVAVREWFGSLSATAWNGTAWTTIAAPAHGLGALDCTSATDCVGYGWDGEAQVNEVLRWNGTAWSTVATPAGIEPGEFGDLACAGSTCELLAFPWDGQPQHTVSLTGTTWTERPMPAAPNLYVYDLDCGSATSCVGVGYAGADSGTYERNAAVLAGGAWSGATASFPQFFVDESGFIAGDCATDTTCTAIGWEGRGVGLVPMAQQFNGTTWTTEALPDLTFDSNLDISCPTADFCAAVGFRTRDSDWTSGQRILIRRNGTWEALDVSALVPYDNLVRVSCASATSCVALANGALVRWDGTTWAKLDGPSTSFNDVSCTGPTWCMAAGTTTWNGFTVPAFYEWEGTEWVPTIPPQVDGGNPWLLAVDCTSPTSCVGTGYTAAESSPAVLHWNGTEWVGNRTSAGEGGSGGLTQVDCTPGGECVAVGEEYSTYRVLVQVTKDPAGRVWEPAKAVTAPAGTYVRATSVSCRPDWCLVIGRLIDETDGTSRPWAHRFVHTTPAA